jgi:ParB family transcriptional regulator, chromosome partitioning protein
MDAEIAGLRAEGKTVFNIEDYADAATLPVRQLNRADGEGATEEDATAFMVIPNCRDGFTVRAAVQGWKQTGFTDRYASAAQLGSMTAEQKAERREVVRATCGSWQAR